MMNGKSELLEPANFFGLSDFGELICFSVTENFDVFSVAVDNFTFGVDVIGDDMASKSCCFSVVSLFHELPGRGREGSVGVFVFGFKEPSMNPEGDRLRSLLFRAASGGERFLADDLRKHLEKVNEGSD